MKFSWAYEVIYVYLISNVVFLSIEMMFVYKIIRTRSDLDLIILKT